MGLLANKVMATIFWNANGIIHVDYGPSDHWRILCRAVGLIRRRFELKAAAFGEEESALHQAHKFVVAMTTFYELRYELTPH